MDPQELTGDWEPFLNCFKGFLFWKNQADCHLVNGTVQPSRFLERGSCCSFKNFFAVTTLSSGDYSFVFPSYRRKGNKLSVKNQLQQLPLQLACYSGKQEGIFNAFFSAADKAGEISRSFCDNLSQYCFLLLSLYHRTAVLQTRSICNDILKLLVICPSSVGNSNNSLAAMGSSCVVNGIGMLHWLSFRETLPFLSGCCLDCHFSLNLSGKLIWRAGGKWCCLTRNLWDASCAVRWKIWVVSAGELKSL